MTGFDFRFDNNLDIERGTTFQGQVGEYYAEEINSGTRPSVKFRRNADDGNLSLLSFNNLNDAESGHSLSFGPNGLEAEETEFDGRAVGKVFKVSYKYNVKDGWRFNGLKDGVKYRTSENPETWEGMTFEEIFQDIVEEQCPGAGFKFSSSKWTEAGTQANVVAPSLSFENTSFTSAIDQVVKAYGNLIWWCEDSGGDWLLCFANRDFTGPTATASDVAVLTGTPEQRNVIGLSIEGPASDLTPEVQVYSQADGYKVQVGGPAWGNQNAREANQDLWNKEKTPPPVRYDLNLTVLASIEARNAEFDKGDYGFSNLVGTVADLSGNASATGTTKRNGFHFAEKDGEVKSFQITVALADNDVTFLPITQWTDGRSPLPPNVTGSFPAKPDDRQSGSPIENGWEIVDDLLTHPDQSYTFSIGTSGFPLVEQGPVFPYEEDDERDDFDEHYDEKKGTLTTEPSGQYHTEAITPNDGSNEFQIDGKAHRTYAIVRFKKLRYGPLTVGKLDPQTSRLIIEHTDFKDIADWSAMGRNDSVVSNDGTLTLDDNLKWTTDSNISDPNGGPAGTTAPSRPLFSLFVPIDFAWGTYREGGTAPKGSGDEAGCVIIFTGVFGVAMPPARVSSGGSVGDANNALTFIQNDYEQHNVIFNAGEVEGYGEPAGEVRNDFDAMQALADARIVEEANNLQSQSGSFTIFPGDSSLVLGQATNGGIITKIRHTYGPFFKTQFTIDNTWQTRTFEEKLEEEASRLEQLVNLGKERTTSALLAAKKAGSTVAGRDTETYLPVTPAAFGSDTDAITSKVMVKQDLPGQGLEAKPALNAKGYDREAKINLLYAEKADHFFSDGMVIATPFGPGNPGEYMRRPNNFSTPIISFNNRFLPGAPNNQNTGFLHNVLTIISNSTPEGDNTKRAAINIAEDQSEILKNVGGDWIEVRDSTSGRDGKMNAYISNDVFMIRKQQSGLTGGARIHAALGCVRPDGEGNLIEGAQLGLGRTIGETDSFVFKVDLGLDSGTGSGRGQIIANGQSPQKIGIYLGQNTIYPDNSFGDNKLYRVRIRPDTDFNSYLIDTSLRLRNNNPGQGTEEHVLQTTYLGNSVTHKIGYSSEQGGLRQGTAPDYAPIVEHSFNTEQQVTGPSTPNNRLIRMTHDLVDPTNDPNIRPSFLVEHNASSVLPARLRLFEEATNSNSGAAEALGLPSFSDKETPKFTVSTGTVSLTQTGSTQQGMFLLESSGSILAFSNAFGGTEPGKLLKILTSSEVGPRRFGTGLKLDGSNIVLVDSNDDVIDSVTATLLFPDEADVTTDLLIGNNGNFGDSTGTGGQIKVSGHPEIVTRDSDWSKVAVFIDAQPPLGLASPTQSNIIDSSSVQTDNALSFRLEGDVTKDYGTTAPVDFFTNDAIADCLSALVEAHNKLVVETRDVNVHVGRLAAAIFGNDIHPSLSNFSPERVNYNRNLNIDLDSEELVYVNENGNEVTETLPRSNWKLVANDDLAGIIRKGISGAFASDHGLVLTPANGSNTGHKVELSSTRGGGDSRGHGITFGPTVGSTGAPRLLDKDGNTGEEKRIPTGFILSGFVSNAFPSSDWGTNFSHIFLDLTHTDVDNQSIGTENAQFHIIHAEAPTYYQIRQIAQSVNPPQAGPITGPGGAGQPGPPGRDGRDGEDGEDGQDGEDGKDGEDGEDGEDGATGPTGPDGPTGATGPDGATGPTGPQGATGPRGPREHPDTLGAACCIQSQPGDALGHPFGTNSKFILEDTNLATETLFPTDFVGSYSLNADGSVASSSASDKTFVEITNDFVVNSDSVSPFMVDLRGNEYRGVVGSQDPLSDKLKATYEELIDDTVPANISGGATSSSDADTDSEEESESSAESDAVEAGKAGQLKDGSTTIDSSVPSQNNPDIRITKEKRPTPLNPDLDIVQAVESVRQTNKPRIAVSAIEWGTRFGAGGGLPNAALGLVTDQPLAPVLNPRAFAHDNTQFIRSVLKLGVQPPDLLIDAAGRYALNGGGYILPTALDGSGNIIVNTDADSRVAYGGNHGILYGLLKDMLGLEIRPDKIVSRRAYGVTGTVTGITGAGGGTTSYHVILNDRGIHGAQFGDDGEYPDAYFYDKSIPEGTIVWGGDVGKVRTQINRFDHRVATGNSGLFEGGLTYALEGDSVEEAITKLDNQLVNASKRFTATIDPSALSSPYTVTHNLGQRPDVFVYDATTNEVIEVGITHHSTTALKVEWNGTPANNWVIVAETHGAT